MAKRLKTITIKHVPVLIDQKIDAYKLEKYEQTGSPITKNSILITALETGLKSMGIIE